MFQNVQYEEKNRNEDKMINLIKIIKNILSPKNIVLYVITFLVSIVGLGGNVSPFSIALVAACFATEIPSFGIIIISLIGNFIGFGTDGGINFILTMLVMIATFMVKRPIYNDETKNEKIKLAKRLFFSLIVVACFRYLFGNFTVYNIITTIINSAIVIIFYKVFTNSLIVLQEITERRAFSLEEVMGASLILSIAISAFGDIAVFGLSIRNILSILIVLILGWKNGILIGTTSGVTIGAVLGIIAEYEPAVIAAYAISGMIAGLLNKFGKIGVVVGFAIGNGILAYISNGTSIDTTVLKEILVASVFLLAVPSKLKINIEEFIGKSKLLPSFTSRALVTGKNTADKLNMVSETLEDMAKVYNTEETDKYNQNREIFITELQNEMEEIPDNMLYDDLTETPNQIVNGLFDILCDKEIITREDLLKTFAKFNNYIIGFDDKEVSQYLEENLRQVINKVNSSYRISKVNFVYKEKIKDNRKNMQEQLGQISKAISDIATEVKETAEEKELFLEEKEKIMILLKQKDIQVEEMWIRKKEKDRFFIDICLNVLNQGIIKNDIEIIEKTLCDVLKEKIELNEKNSKISKEKSILNFVSADKYVINIGIAEAKKNKNMVSGDSILNIRLKDGKNLVAISDGMGSGAEARKSSQIAIKMLERLLSSGFDKDKSIEIINKAILNNTEEIYATLDIVIIDLYRGNIEFIKNGACPSFIKNNKKVQIVKDLSIPAGAMEEIKLTSYEKNLESGDVILMCSDGILDSNIEFKNKELWIKYLLADMETQNPQKMADIVLNEAIDNCFGINKDDMSVIILKVK